jgi:sucrose-6F-phosphate phosphohydrolase
MASMGTGVSPRLLVVSDLDNTMVDHKDKENSSLLRFNSVWETSFRHDSMLVFSTGRSPFLYQKLRSEVPLLTPDIAITSVGTEIVYGDTLKADAGWEEELNQGWDRNVVIEEATKLALKFQDESELRPHKMSFYVEKANAAQIVEDLSEKLKARGVNAKLIYSGGLDLDVLPQGAGKGQALAYLLKKFKAENRHPVNTLVCGDSGNDAELFAVDEVHGVMVGNAMEELVQWYDTHAKGNDRIFRATERCAAGIVQAMQHFGFVSSL